MKPDAAVIVATIRALKMHGGGSPVVPGKPLADEYKVKKVTKQYQNQFIYYLVGKR